MHTSGGVFWDGLFSLTPPVRELIDAGPDEIWVIQINPKERDREPRTVVEIADRRNELAGNISLHQELHVIEKIDRMLDDGLLTAEAKYRPIVVRGIELARSRVSQSLGTASKRNRDPAFLRGLIAHGEARADEFLVALAFEDAWRRRDADAIMAFFTEASEVVSRAPFPELGPQRGLPEIRAFVEDHLLHGLTVDLSKKQIARDHVEWSVGVHRGDPARRVAGRIEVAFRRRTVISLRLSADGGAPIPLSHGDSAGRLG